ncbi:MAG TPA: methyltransferase [Spirillospora sp.]|nr:methyltransferase [Spirillospora sp.]
MPLAPNFFERAIFLTFNQGPGVTLDLWGGPAFRIVLAAIRLNIFETLTANPLTANDLAQRLNLDLRGARILLDTLTALGYLKEEGDQFANSAMTHKWLTDSGDINFSPYFRFWGDVLEKLWPWLEESFRSGQPPVHLYQWIEGQPETSRHFQEGMIAIARYVGVSVARALPLPPDARRVLDIGGGHAAYSIALCRQHPQLTAVVFDSPQALVTGQRLIVAENMAGQVSVQAGDLMVDDLGTGYDAALLFNIIHGFLPDQNLALLQKAARALNPGGMIAILEQLPDSAPLPLANALAHILSVSYFHLLGGQIYPYEEIAGWLHASGFSNVRRKNLLRGGSTLITAVK